METYLNLDFLATVVLKFSGKPFEADSALTGGDLILGTFAGWLPNEGLLVHDLDIGLGHGEAIVSDRAPGDDNIITVNSGFDTTDDGHTGRAGAVLIVTLTAIPAVISGALRPVNLAIAVCITRNTVVALIVGALLNEGAIGSDSSAAGLELVPELGSFDHLGTGLLDGDSLVLNSSFRVLTARVVKTTLDVCGPAFLNKGLSLELGGLDLLG